ncbi:kinase-like domain-containing protein [Rhizophagus irregularis DAOM 181602=DAOM 197198]|nr:kinase-like domain-containing protein [Rhizophagus irregularis DAOM 181602=DAOM 197198]
MEEFMLCGDLIQKAQLKAKTSDKILEWIEYDRFENVEYLAKGGFGTIYKAIWKDGYIEEWDFENNKWIRSKYWVENYENFPVVLKCLHNSQDVTVDFLREIELHTTISSRKVTFCYGITKDPESNNFMMVMPYSKDGSLRQRLNNSFNSMEWKVKLDFLERIANGLKDIHSQGLIHHDIHCGNILNHDDYIRITDLGLCRPANVKSSQDERDHEINKQIEEADKINERFTSSSLPYNDLPEPKNAVDDNDDDNSFEYSESIEAIDFTKLNLDKNS